MTLPLPVRDMLAASNLIRPAWAQFDAAWYLNTYPEAHENCGGRTEFALDFYLKDGMRLGHSPSPLFDEDYYLRRNPDIVTLITQRRYLSGFDHFCQHGYRISSPHWLFDDDHYGRLYDDMSLENLDFHGYAGRYDHYLKSGQFEGRQGHFLFDSAFYRPLAISAGATDAELDLRGPYLHYLFHLFEADGDIAPSIFFDPVWYLRQNAGAMAAIERQQFRSSIEHYLRNENPELFDPVPEFSEAYYVESNRDVREAIENGRFRCGYQHFVQFGTFELRRPHPKIDLVLYRDANPSVRDDLNSGKSRDPFSHLRTYGISRGLTYAASAKSVPITEESAHGIFLYRAENNALLASFQTLNFRAERPVISVIMVAFNRFELSMLSLTSLRTNFTGEIELIFLDNGSSDQTKHIDRYVAGAKIIHLDENIGFLLAANQGLNHVSAPVTLYLNNDIELGFNAINSALRVLNSSSDIAAVGGKVIRSHGKLQEAGSIIWNNGTAQGYMRDQEPLKSEVNFLRSVDYCSAVFLMCKTHLLRSLKGFDEAFSPAYYEDTDLCVRMCEAGFKIIYDPKVVLYHFEFASLENSDAASALMRRGRRLFVQKHQNYLKTKFERTEENILHARTNAKRQKILFVEDTIPLRNLGSGFVRSNDVVQAIAQAGYDVSIFPVNGRKQDIASCITAFQNPVEVLYDYDFTKMAAFLEQRKNYYDLIWVSRAHNLRRILPLIRAAGIDIVKIPVILDSEAIAAVRNAHRSAILDPDDVVRDFDEELKDEFAEAKGCSHVTAVNLQDLTLLQKLNLSSISMLGTCVLPQPTMRNFVQRKGLLFVASIHQADSPNLDSLYWFRDEIFPHLKNEMTYAPILNFVGYVDQAIDVSEFNEDQGIKIHGAVDDLRPYYNDNRVFVAPTRFAAGTPYKMYEAASFGLPCVATDLLADQLGWQTGVELLSASVRDPAQFAAKIAMLYQTEELWSQLRNNVISRLEIENDPETFGSHVRKIIEDALDRPKRSRRSSTIGKRRSSWKPVAI